MIDYLKLKNFRRHRDEHFEFGPGLNVICGPNWAGKTTLLSAITYALFGAKAVQGSATDLITDGEADMQVEVGFSVNGRHYFVTRGPKKAALKADSAEHKPIATGQTPVTDEIELLIGSSSKDFLDFNVTRQEDSANLLALGSAKLGEYVARVTGVDTIDEVLGKLKTEVVRADAVVGTCHDQEAEIANKAKNLADKVGANNRAIADLQLREAGLRFMTEENAKLSKEASEKLKQLEANREAGRAVAVQKGVLKNILDLLKAAKAACPEVPAGDPDKASAEHDEILSKQTYQQWHDRTKHDFEEAVDSAKANLALYGITGPEPGDVQSALDAKIGAEDKLKEAELQYKQAKEASESSMCPYCMRPFENTDPKILEAKAEEAAALLEEAKEVVKKVGDKLNKEATKESAANSWEAGKRDWEAYLKSSEEALKAHMGVEFERVTADQVKDSAARLADLKSSWADYDKARNLVARRAVDVDEAEAALKAMTVKKTVKGPTSGEVEAAQRASQEAADELQSEMLRVHILENSVNNSNNVINNLSESLDRMRRDQGLWETATMRLSEVKELQAYLRKNRERFTDSFWATLLGHASEFVQNATSGAVSGIGIGNGFTYTEDGRERSVAGNASGMQKAIFSTAIKLSLVEALGAKFDVLFFDEVTAAAGDDTSLLFTGLLAKAGQQSLLVTHRQADAAVADRVIEVASH